jgi:hypothetical protein
LGQSSARRVNQKHLALFCPDTQMFDRPPAEAELERTSAPSPPSVRQMVITLGRLGFIRRQPGVIPVDREKPKHFLAEKEALSYITPDHQKEAE